MRTNASSHTDQVSANYTIREQSPVSILHYKEFPMENKLKGNAFCISGTWLAVARQQNSLFQNLNTVLVQSLGHRVTEKSSSNNFVAQTQTLSSLGISSKCPLFSGDTQKAPWAGMNRGEWEMLWVRSHMHNSGQGQLAEGQLRLYPSSPYASCKEHENQFHSKPIFQKP